MMHEAPHRDLVAWQLARKLRSEVLRLTSSGAASRNLKFRSQIEDAAASICRNLREGYYRFNPREFSNFVRYSQGSLSELDEQLDEGVERRFWTDEEVETARKLCRRTAAALGGLRKYLITDKARKNAERIRTSGTSGTQGTS